MKKFAVVAMLAASISFVLSGCGETKILHCDHCGEEVEVEADSNMEEDWLIYCPDCNEELFGDDPVLGS